MNAISSVSTTSSYSFAAMGSSAATPDLGQASGLGMASQQSGITLGQTGSPLSQNEMLQAMITLAILQALLNAGKDDQDSEKSGGLLAALALAGQGNAQSMSFFSETSTTMQMQTAGAAYDAGAAMPQAGMNLNIAA